MSTSLIVVLGGSLAGVLKHLINAWTSRMVGPEFPAGIFGGFTTFSGLSLDAALLNERGQPWLAAAYTGSFDAPVDRWRVCGSLGHAHLEQCRAACRIRCLIAAAT